MDEYLCALIVRLREEITGLQSAPELSLSITTQPGFFSALVDVFIVRK
jgi:hypothetical protein